MAELLFWTSTLLLVYVFFGYYAFLLLLNKIWRNKVADPPSEGVTLPTVTTIVPVYNGQDEVESRIENLLELDYPPDKHEIIIASDGSTDRTVDRARNHAHGHPQVKLLDFPVNRGRALVHNDGVAAARGEVIVFTDVDTKFARDFIKNIVAAFADPGIGCVDSMLVYQSAETAIADAETLYYGYEKTLRRLESNLGILATASGPAMAVLKKLWRPLSPSDDCDFVTPMDVIQQGYRVTLATGARAYDLAPAAGIRAEIRIRIRMTSKNLVGTLRRWSIATWLRHPLVSWGLVSHKILRWLSGFLMLAAFGANLILLQAAPVYRLAFSLQLIFYALAGLGFLAEMFRKKNPIPLTNFILSFCVASAGMGLGVVKGLLGKAPATYRRAG